MSDPALAVRVVFVTAPPDRAHDLAREIVEAGVAACVNVVPGLRSVYRWRGEVLDDPETLLVVKTAADRLGDLTNLLTERHPYEVPEMLSLAPEAGFEAYLAWVVESTRSAAVSTDEEVDSGTADPAPGR